MKKKLLVLLVALSILASSLSPGVSAVSVPDMPETITNKEVKQWDTIAKISEQEDDYGNTFSDAFNWGVLVPGVNSRAGSIEYSKDIDMFKFTAPETGTYTFSTSNLASSIVYLDVYIYNNSQNVLMSRLAGYFSTVSFQYTLTAGQTYYLKAEGYMGTGTYTINISAPASTDFVVIYDANGGAGAPAQQTNPTNVTGNTPATPKSYIVTYNVNGGTVISPNSKQVYCTFKDWNVNLAGSGTSYNSGAPYPPGVSATLYAQWNNPAAGELPVPIWSEHNFKGWFTAASGGTPVTPSTIITGNTTIYAQWESSIIYTVKFNANGGDGTMADQIFTSGVLQTLDANTFTKPGCFFVGWTPIFALGFVYLDQQKISVDSDLILYAIWDDYGNAFSEAYSWMIQPDKNSIEGTVDFPGDVDIFKLTVIESGVYYFSANRTDLSDVTLELHLNSGDLGFLIYERFAINQPFYFQYQLAAGQTYYLQAIGGNKTGTYAINITGSTIQDFILSYNANGGADAPAPQINPAYVTGNTPVTPKSYTVTYNVNGGTVISPNSKQVYCTFKDWNDNLTGSGTSYNSGAPYPPGVSATLYAQWNNPAAGELPTPLRSEYNFKGWFTAASGGTPVTPSTIIIDFHDEKDA
jgi:uncharacterized repeat protein (TIGR02543 family)